MLELKALLLTQGMHGMVSQVEGFAILCATISQRGLK